MIKAIVVGVAGRMGNRILWAIHETPNIQLAGAVERKDHPALGRDAGEAAGMEKWGVPIVGDIRQAIDAGDVIIEFTNAESSVKTLQVAAEKGKCAVIGSTGFSGAQMEEVKGLTRKIACVLSPNMSVGVNVLFKVVGDLAKILGDDFDVEVIEAHHRMKKDAPSGTAVKIGQILAKCLGRNYEEVAVFERKGITGERKKKDIGMQTIRAGDIVGEHTVIFGGIGERLEIIHRAHSRDNFARGAIRAAAWVVKQTPGLYDMQDVLGLK
ncbi:MAG: 4-hydroxy-tetrahydrodipicolinate reductase [Syntrophaceae bacterium]|nr:4-hydroxy-tetrahydrodipicolinate reductase [Syntrophaceae bacterium]